MRARVFTATGGDSTTTALTAYAVCVCFHMDQRDHHALNQRVGCLATCRRPPCVCVCRAASASASRRHDILLVASLIDKVCVWGGQE